MYKMKDLLAFVLIACFIGVSLATPSFEMGPRSEQFDTNENNEYLQVPFAACEDVIIHGAVVDGTSRLQLRRRDANGEYQLMDDVPAPQGPFHPISNGKWIALVRTTLMISKIVDYKIVNLTDYSDYYHTGAFFADGSLVLASYIQGSQPESYTLETWEYAAETNLWAPVNETTVPYIPASAYNPYSIFWNNFLVTHNYSAIAVFERKPDRSWAIVEEVLGTPPALSTGSVVYNGIDTIVSVRNSRDEVEFWVKLTDGWSAQTISFTDYGVTGAGYPGLALSLVDQDTILLAFPWTVTEGNLNYPIGKVLIFKRTTPGAVWTPYVYFYTTVNLVLGNSVGFNDYDYITGMDALNSKKTGKFFAVPRCFDTPINVTCATRAVDECTVDPATLYTINDRECAPVQVKLESIAAPSNYQVQFEYSFARLSVNATCTAKVTCPVPPVAVTQPMAVPVATMAPKGKTSDVAKTVVNLLALVALHAVILN